EVAHDLQARDQRGPHLAGEAELLVADAVYAVADDQLRLPRLNVDVGGAAVIGVLDDAVGELDDRAGLLVDLVLVELAVVPHAKLDADLLHHVVETGRAALLLGKELV